MDLKHQHCWPLRGSVSPLRNAAPTCLLLGRNKGKFVQVMNLGGCHWVAVSNVGRDEDVINWMDSLHGLPTSTAKREVADILHSPLPVITVQCLNVQKQRGGSDCGLFALAFITAVCHGDDPTSLYFDQENMRSHLITSIESGEATPFPVIKEQTRRKRLVDTVHIELHCVCRPPDNGTPMIKCDECLCWFHAVCVNAVLGEKPWFAKLVALIRWYSFPSFSVRCYTLRFVSVTLQLKTNIRL